MLLDQKKTISLVLKTIGILVSIVLLLNLFGKVFIEEISQNLFVEGEGDKQTEVPTINEMAPYFELQNVNGKLIRSTELRNKPLIVVFWNTWNEISSSQFKIVEEVTLNYSDLFKVIAINSQENRDTILNFIRRSDYKKTEVLLDTNGGVSDLFEARSLPAFYFIDKNGLLMDRYYGFLDAQEIVEKMSKFSK